MKYRRDHVRKVCGCPRPRWGSCGHPWYFAFHFGHAYRFSLDKYLRRHLESWGDARTEADKIAVAIREGTFAGVPAPRTAVPVPIPTSTPLAAPTSLTFSAFSDVWKLRVGSALASGKIHGYRLSTICAFKLPGTDPVVTFGDTPIDRITLDHIEAFRDARKADGLSAVAVNHDLKLLRSMFNWAIRRQYLAITPFRIGTVPALSLEREIPRHRRFERADDETRLLAAATVDPLLRAVIIALLDTACRPGEILNLQWRDVSLERREFVVQAIKAKTRTMRLVPLSTRLMAILEVRRLDPAGRELPADAYVFGDPLGRRVKSVRDGWNAAAASAGLSGFQLRDLRHESACRFEEAGVPVSDVSKLLGHTNLSTTSRYLMNTHRRAMRRAVDRLEEFANNLQSGQQSDAESGHDSEGKNPPKSLN
jgi:integrase